MGQRSGFFNALKSSTGYDRKYNANDYSENLAAIISNGVRRSGDNELRVTAAGGMALNVAVGRAWIEGHWYINDTVFTEFSVPTAPTGDRGRVDRIALRLNVNIEGRLIELVYLTGTASTSPTAPALTRADGIYEIALADINVGAAVTSITQENIVDQRPNSEVCGWITSPIGYQDYFTNLDAEFNEWFQEKKDTMASATLFKKYEWKTTLESETSSITFNIPQYDPSGVDIVEIYANGIRLFENKNYTLSGSIINFTSPKIGGTDITVEVYKSIDGTGLGSVSDEITELQNQLATVKNIGEYIYICNGVDDNVKLSEIAQNFLADDSSFDQMIISVYGTFGVNAPYAGSGTSISRYRWFSLGGAGSTNKRIVFDFEGCSQITLNCESGKYYIGFYGLGVTIKNANIVVNHKNTEGTFQMFTASQGSIAAENCRFRIDAYQGSYIASTGTFTNCKATVTNAKDNSYCFMLNSNSLLRINNGEYLAYTGTNSYNASVIYSDSSASDGVVITNAMNCPTVAKTSNYQKNAVQCSSGYGAFNDTITSLTISKATNQNLRGNIPVSKPDRM